MLALLQLRPLLIEDRRAPPRLYFCGLFACLGMTRQRGLRARQGFRGGDVIALGNLVHEAPRLGGGGRNSLAGCDEIERNLRAGKTRKPLRSAPAGHEAELHFGKANPRLFRRHPVMAGEGDFEAAAERRAMQRGHDGLGTVFDSGANVVDVRALECGAELQGGAKFGDVGSHGESWPCAGQDDGARLGIGRCVPDGREKPVADAARQHIQRRIIDSYNANAVCVLVFDGTCGHECSRKAVILL